MTSQLANIIEQQPASNTSMVILSKNKEYLNQTTDESDTWNMEMLTTIKQFITTFIVNTEYAIGTTLFNQKLPFINGPYCAGTGPNNLVKNIKPIAVPFHLFTKYNAGFKYTFHAIKYPTNKMTLNIRWKFNNDSFNERHQESMIQWNLHDEPIKEIIFHGPMRTDMRLTRNGPDKVLVVNPDISAYDLYFPSYVNWDNFFGSIHITTASLYQPPSIFPSTFKVKVYVSLVEPVFANEHLPPHNTPTFNFY